MSAVGHGEQDHSHLMDRIYRHQRHFYDLTRRYYLLGRDRLVDELDAERGTRVLEVGCGTGWNLIRAAKRFPEAEFYGMDISHEMLATAQRASRRHGTDLHLTYGDATCFNPYANFGISRFERIYMSYTLSMIPDWEATLAQAICNLAPGGSLHIVDFGEQERLPRWFRSLLRVWLTKFHVSPRGELKRVMEALATKLGAELEFRPLYCGYAWYAVLRLPLQDE
ncbi:class I SAM-dependent methyltransferase [Parvibaculum sp.]|jgi:S-adenosylmethionine-diacylgycerolhomoserine-N-methlytransferase|uniref:class I SAM-dependent methyltransferase n=1 Tax=Parvibaculum sp. TaxID=2024848 RepID=UPI001B17D638|nr:class I SAM-dependent methyltransferase [Parvibaculum sp.]MBO6634005.1 methyltransferase domain-containing protein [Parvibaculum sp.]MBO6678541.1 methyltransferase domain-containing protein [Parvibaculum sp.]MBO6685997.1 methyltransferase domain-containing protein [Parvibaculum sp.]MBO6906216.1 methyltransferase domain-containing protein [Parvibaculum sp.]